MWFRRKICVGDDGHVQAQLFMKLLDASFRLLWRQIIFAQNGERIVETKDNEIMKGKSIVQSKD